MQVSVEKISPVERKLTITVPAEQVEKAYTNQLDQLVKNANLKGFRPGKAPRQVIEQKFGADARKEAWSEVIQQSLYQAINDEKLKPVSTPKIEPKTMLANQPLEFVATFEVLPDIEKVNFSMDKIEKCIVDIKPEDIDYVIKQLQKQYTKWQLVDRPAKESDRVVIDYYATFEGKTDKDNKIQNFPLELGSKAMLPGFEEGLVGAKAGEQKNLSLKFPEDFSAKEQAGKAIDFVVDVKQVLEAEPPVMNGDFVKKLGIASGEEGELTEQIKQSLEQERDRVVKEKLKEQIFRQLLEQNPIDVPSALVSREAKVIHDEIYPHEHNHQHGDEEQSAFEEMAKKRVALALIVSEYAKQAELKADKEQVQKRIQEIAASYEKPQEVTAWLMADERRASIEAQVIEDQVMEKLMENIPVTEKAMSYAELKGIRI